MLVSLAELGASRCQRGRQGRQECQGAQGAGGNREPRASPYQFHPVQRASVLTGEHRAGALQASWERKRYTYGSTCFTPFPAIFQSAEIGSPPSSAPIPQAHGRDVGPGHGTGAHLRTGLMGTTLRASGGSNSWAASRATLCSRHQGNRSAASCSSATAIAMANGWSGCAG